VITEFSGVDFFVSAKNPAALVEVTLENVRARLCLPAFGWFLDDPVVDVPSYSKVFLPKLTTKLLIGKKQNRREARSVRDEHAPFAIVDFAPRTGKEDPSLILDALTFDEECVAQNLTVGEAAEQDYDHQSDHSIHEDDPGFDRVVCFDDAHSGSLSSVSRL
jgi:hypothetical protein